MITTRTPVADVADYERTSVLRRDLEQLSDEAGAQLLRALGMKGHEVELRSASHKFGGHSLALTLLGSNLSDAYPRNIRCRKAVSECFAYGVRQGVLAQEVMTSYQTWLGEGLELSVLRLLGFFDRSADERAVEALLQPPVITGLTELLVGLTPAEWRAVLARLRRARLLTDEDPLQPRQLDAHPSCGNTSGSSCEASEPPPGRKATGGSTSITERCRPPSRQFSGDGAAVFWPAPEVAHEVKL